MYFKQLNKFKRRIATPLIISSIVTSMTFPSLSAPFLPRITSTHTSSNASCSDATETEWDDDTELLNDLDVTLLKTFRLVDTINPEITNITAAVDEVDLPGTVKFTVDIIEEGSGIQSITARISNLHSSRWVNKTYSFPAGTYSGTFELEYIMDDITLPSGIWDIQLVATDNNFNSSNNFDFTSFESGRFYVNGNDDFEPPIISDIRIISDTVTVPGEIVVEVDTIDESGIQSVMVNLQGTDENGNQSTAGKNCYFYGNNVTNTYTCRIPITKSSVSGTWKLYFVSACDAVNNHSNGSMPEAWEQQSCTVVNYYRDDITKPVVNSVSFLSTSGTAPYSFDVLLDITEEASGIDGIYLTLSNYETQSYKQFSLTSLPNDGKSGEYIIPVSFNNLDTSGIWTVSNLFVVDKVGNISDNLNNTNCEFELLDSAVLESIYVKQLPDKITYTQGDSLDTTGLVIYGLNTDGTENEIVGFSVGEFIPDVAGEQSILITYDVFRTEFKVTVNEKEAISPDDTLPEPDDEPVIPDIPDTPNDSEETENPSDTPVIPDISNSADITDTTPDSSSNVSGGSSSAGGSSGGGGGGGNSFSASAPSLYKETVSTTSYPKLIVGSEYITTGEWVQDINSLKWTLYTSDGHRTYNSWVLLNSRFYLIGIDGYMLTGWVNVNEEWYYMSADGAMCTGWVFINNSWYYFEDNGKMLANCNTSDGYTLDASGRLI